MIQQDRNIMATMNLFAHAPEYSISARQAAGNVPKENSKIEQGDKADSDSEASCKDGGVLLVRRSRAAAGNEAI
jgi:hypothetical protein